MSSQTEGTAAKPQGRKGPTLTQETIVFALAIILFAVFSVTLDGFFSIGNVVTLLRSVAVLGMLALGMALVVIARGLDLAMVASLVVGLSWSLQLTQGGLPFLPALLAGAALTVAAGLVIGLIVAFAEIPAVFTTLAMGAVIFGFGNAFLFKIDVHNAPADIEWLRVLGYGSLFGIPVAVYAFAGLAVLVHLLLRKTRYGRFLYAMGDNPDTARMSGLPVRPMIVSQYMVSGLIGFVAGLVIVASNSGINTRLYNSTLVYDVLLVVVLGGIGLSGGRGGVANVLVGTLLVGTLLTGMTIMNLSYTGQNLIKSLVLLLALIADTFINPRDEQTSQQGDI